MPLVRTPHRVGGKRFRSPAGDDARMKTGGPWFGNAHPDCALNGGPRSVFRPPSAGCWRPEVRRSHACTPPHRWGYTPRGEPLHGLAERGFAALPRSGAGLKTGGPSLPDRAPQATMRGRRALSPSTARSTCSAGTPAPGGAEGRGPARLLAGGGVGGKSPLAALRGDKSARPGPDSSSRWSRRRAAAGSPRQRSSIRSGSEGSSAGTGSTRSTG